MSQTPAAGAPSSGITSAEVADGDCSSPQRIVGQADPAVRLAGRDAELVEQVREVLLDGRLRDHELVGDRAGRRRLGEHVAGEERSAQRDEHVALACGQRRRRLLGLGLRRPRRPGSRGRSAASGPRGSRRRVAGAATTRSARRSARCRSTSPGRPRTSPPRTARGPRGAGWPSDRRAARRRSRPTCRWSSGRPPAEAASRARPTSPRSRAPRSQA